MTRRGIERRSPGPLANTTHWANEPKDHTHINVIIVFRIAEDLMMSYIFVFVDCKGNNRIYMQ